MKQIYNKELRLIKPTHFGNKVLDDRFLNYHKISAPKLMDILRWRFTRSPERAVQKQSPWSASVTPIVNLADKSHDRIIWLGHASFLITLNGKNIIIDPLFGNCLFIKRKAAMPCDVKELLNIDYILISHSHYDHLDKNSLKQLTNNNPQAIIYCGLNHHELLRQYKINNQVIEAGWYQEYPIQTDNLEFFFMPALHWSKRTFSDRNKRLWGSFVIKSQKSKIYFMGDSGYSPHFKEIGTLFNGFDYCLMGIGAYSPRYIMQYSHVNPDEAVQAFNDLQGKNFIPMHYGTYTLTDEPLSEPLHKIKHLEAEAKIHGRLLLPVIGETVQLD